MMVYVVKMLVDDEYGCMEAVDVYASESDALAWVEEHQEMQFPWYCEDEKGVPLYEVQAFELH